MSKITLSGIRREDSYKDSEFQRLYERLFSTQASDLSDIEKINLLKWALFFFNAEDNGVKRLGYRIVVRYSNQFEDYVPLYDIALNAGFIPVAKFIENKFLDKGAIEQSFVKSFLSAYQDTFREDGKYLSIGQKELMDFGRSVKSDYLIVAPTSYGKSEMIVSKALDNLDKKVCVLVPSKALLAQTKRRLLDNETIAKTAKRIITHPEMYRPDDKVFLAALTQERLLRMMQTHPDFSVDILLVDEAHNLLDGGERGALLLQALMLLKHRNQDIELKFFTPFLANSKSIETPYSDYSLDFRHVQEFIKIEKYYIYDIKNGGGFSLYDQFVNRYFPIDTLPLDEIEFIQQYKASKNIVYLNKPRAVEEVAMNLADAATNIDIAEGADGEFKDAYAAIADFLHPDYKLLGCLKKGVIYHHGRIPELIRLYIERIFSKHPAFSFIVTSSTLLEGVNIPAEKMFLLDVKKGTQILRRSSFKNLAGRVCRFSEVFSNENGSLRMLEPNIYIVNGRYTSSKFSTDNFFNTRVKWQEDSEDQDNIENILLKKEYANDDEEKLARKRLEYIENVEPGTTKPEVHDLDVRYVSSDIAKACFRNNIHEFDIHQSEAALVKNIEKFKDIEKIADTQTLLRTINDIFITNISREKDDDFIRLGHQPARNFYSLILSWKMKGASFKEMIAAILRHWEEKQENAKSGDDHKVYVGSSWGEVKRTPEDFNEMYIDLRQKKPSQRVNIAIIRIKEEQDFIEYKLMKYIEALNDLEMLDIGFYEHIKYGSSDAKVICLLKNGISIELCKCLLNGKYDQFLKFDLGNDDVRISREAIPVMEDEGENRILIFELIFHAL